MALSQQQLTAVAASLSSARLGTYINASGFGANATPLDIYVWNALISGAFFTSLHICEVVMRNAISHALELKYGVNWPWSQGLERTLSKWSKEELQSARQGIPAGSTGKVIAELKFAFWCRLLTSGQDQHLWNANIRIVFPNLPFPMTVAAGRTMLYNDMEALRVFRNRIAHHEPIIGYPLVQYQARIQRLLKLRCAVIDQDASFKILHQPHINATGNEVIVTCLAEGAGVGPVAAPATVEDVVGIDGQDERPGELAFPAQVDAAGGAVAAQRRDGGRLPVRVQRQHVLPHAIPCPQVQIRCCAVLAHPVGQVGSLRQHGQHGQRRQIRRLHHDANHAAIHARTERLALPVDACRDAGGPCLPTVLLRGHQHAVGKRARVRHRVAAVAVEGAEVAVPVRPLLAGAKLPRCQALRPEQRVAATDVLRIDVRGVGVEVGRVGQLQAAPITEREVGLVAVRVAQVQAGIDCPGPHGGHGPHAPRHALGARAQQHFPWSAADLIRQVRCRERAPDLVVVGGDRIGRLGAGCGIDARLVVGQVVHLVLQIHTHAPLAARRRPGPVKRGLVEAARRPGGAATVAGGARRFKIGIGIGLVDQGRGGAVLQHGLEHGAAVLAAVSKTGAVVGLFVGAVGNAVKDRDVGARTVFVKHVETGMRAARSAARRHADAVRLAHGDIDAERGAGHHAMHEDVRRLPRLPGLPRARIGPVPRRRADFLRAIVAQRDAAVHADMAAGDVAVQARGRGIGDDLDAGDVGAAHGLQRHRAVVAGRCHGSGLAHVLGGPVGRPRHGRDVVDGLVELFDDLRFAGGDGDRWRDRFRFLRRARSEFAQEGVARLRACVIVLDRSLHQPRKHHRAVVLDGPAHEPADVLPAVRAAVRPLHGGGAGLAIHVPTVDGRIALEQARRHVVRVGRQRQAAVDDLAQERGLLQRRNPQRGTQFRDRHRIVQARHAGEVAVAVIKCLRVVAHAGGAEARRHLLRIPDHRFAQPRGRIGAMAPCRIGRLVARFVRQVGRVGVLQHAAVKTHEADGNFEGGGGRDARVARAFAHQCGAGGGVDHHQAIEHCRGDGRCGRPRVRQQPGLVWHLGRPPAERRLQRQVGHGHGSHAAECHRARPGAARGQGRAYQADARRQCRRMVSCFVCFVCFVRCVHYGGAKRQRHAGRHLLQLQLGHQRCRIGLALALRTAAQHIAVAAEFLGPAQARAQQRVKAGQMARQQQARLDEAREHGRNRQVHFDHGGQRASVVRRRCQCMATGHQCVQQALGASPAPQCMRQAEQVERQPGEGDIAQPCMGRCGGRRRDSDGRHRAAWWAPAWPRTPVQWMPAPSATTTAGRPARADNGAAARPRAIPRRQPPANRQQRAARAPAPGRTTSWLTPAGRQQTGCCDERHGHGKSAQERAFTWQRGTSVFQVGRHLAAVFRQLVHDLAVKPDIHRGRIVGVARVVQLLRQFLARLQAAVQFQQLQQVDNRGAPVQGLARLLGLAVEDGFHVHFGQVHAGRRGSGVGGRDAGRCRCRGHGGGVGWRRHRGALRRLGDGRVRGRENFVENIAEHTHGESPRHAAERLDQRGMVGIERAELVDDAGIMLLGRGGDFLHLRRRDLLRLLRGHLRLRALAEEAADAAGQRSQHRRADVRQQLIEHAGLAAVTPCATDVAGACCATSPKSFSACAASGAVTAPTYCFNKLPKSNVMVTPVGGGTSIRGLSAWSVRDLTGATRKMRAIASPAIPDCLQQLQLGLDHGRVRIVAGARHQHKFLARRLDEVEVALAGRRHGEQILLALHHVERHLEAGPELVQVDFGGDAIALHTHELQPGIIFAGRVIGFVLGRQVLGRRAGPRCRHRFRAQAFVLADHAAENAGAAGIGPRQGAQRVDLVDRGGVAGSTRQRQRGVEAFAGGQRTGHLGRADVAAEHCRRRLGHVHAQHRAPGAAQQDHPALAEALRGPLCHGNAVVAQLLDQQRHVIRDRVASVGHAGAALIPLDNRQILFPGLIKLVGKRRGGIARAAVDQQHHGIGTTAALDPHPLLDAADAHKSFVVDGPACCGADGVGGAFHDSKPEVGKMRAMPLFSKGVRSAAILASHEKNQLRDTVPHPSPPAARAGTAGGLRHGIAAVGVLVELRAVPVAGGSAGRQGRSALAAGRRPRGVVAGAGGRWLCRHVRLLRAGAHCAGHRRSAAVSGGRARGQQLVPGARTGHANGRVQLGLATGRGAGAAGARAPDCRHQLALGVLRDGRARHHRGRGVGGAVPRPGVRRTDGRRTGIPGHRPGGRHGRQDGHGVVAGPVPLPRDVGHDAGLFRLGVPELGVSDLAARLPAHRAPHGPGLCGHCRVGPVHVRLCRGADCRLGVRPRGARSNVSRGRPPQRGGRVHAGHGGVHHPRRAGRQQRGGGRVHRDRDLPGQRLISVRLVAGDRGGATEPRGITRRAAKLRRLPGWRAGAHPHRLYCADMVVRAGAADGRGDGVHGGDVVPAAGAAGDTGVGWPRSVVALWSGREATRPAFILAACPFFSSA
uniref:Abi-like protein n=1 Tax=Tanacetum cinerariifolium TaxID=118510 RepID=A0A699GJN3_TANCI|nr:hypothetical protein [Tanacetum cinerariifolium]